MVGPAAHSVGALDGRTAKEGREPTDQEVFAGSASSPWSSSNVPQVMTLCQLVMFSIWST